MLILNKGFNLIIAAYPARKWPAGLFLCFISRSWDNDNADKTRHFFTLLQSSSKSPHRLLSDHLNLNITKYFPLISTWQDAVCYLSSLIPNLYNTTAPSPRHHVEYPEKTWFSPGLSSEGPDNTHERLTLPSRSLLICRLHHLQS